MLSTLMLQSEFCFQQATRFVRHTPQPSFQGLPALALFGGFRLDCFVGGLLAFLFLSLLARHGLPHAFALGGIGCLLRLCILWSILLRGILLWSSGRI
jgi:hypothetical protein